MTRLVSVRVLCDSCLSAQARVYCVAVRRALCTQCSQTQASHSRAVDLARTAAALAFCDRCDAAPATVYSPCFNYTLCGSCDAATEQESVESESGGRGLAAATSARGTRRRSSQDIVLALKQRSVRFTGPGPPPPGLARPASSPSPYSALTGARGLALQQPVLDGRQSSRALASAYANCGAPLYGHGCAPVAAAAAASAAAARLLAGGPLVWPNASSVGAANGNGGDTDEPRDKPPLSSGNDLRNMSQYFYIAHYQQQQLQQLYLQQMQEEAAAAAAVAATTGHGKVLQHEADCGDGVAPSGHSLTEIKKEQFVDEGTLQSDHSASANGKRSRSPPNTALADVKRASALRKIGGSGDISASDRTGDGSGEGSGGSGGGSASDLGVDERRDGSADGSGSSRRSDVVAPLGASNCAVLTAAAVAAAGEMYLLNSVHADSPNGSLILPPPEVDPAGLVTAANVAAAGASAAIAADAAAANAAAMAAVYGSQPKRERALRPGALGQKRTGLGDRCSPFPSSSNLWTQPGNVTSSGFADVASSGIADAASSLHPQPGSSAGGIASKRSSVPSGSDVPGSMVGSSIIGNGAGSLDEGGMPDVSGFDENLDFSAFDSQQPQALRFPRSFALDSPREASDT